MAKTKRYVEAHHSEKITVFEVAEKLGLKNWSRFLSVFEEKVGLRFSEFLSNVRVLASRKFLLNQNYTETEIAREVGFTNVTTFRRAFLKKFGETPTCYRKRIPKSPRTD